MMQVSSRTSAWPGPWLSPQLGSSPTLLAGVGAALAPPATEDVVWLVLLLPPLESASLAILMLMMIGVANNSC